MNEVKQTSIQFLLGGIAGAVGVTTVYPIDLLKTNIQQSRSKISVSQCFKQIIKNRGLLGLYSGLKPQLIGVGPEKAIKLAVNDLAKRTFSNYPCFNNINNIYTDILAGGLAGASQIIITNPLEIVKIRLQIHTPLPSPTSIVSTHTPVNNIINNTRISTTTIIKELGITGLYKGSRACLMRDIPFSMIYFPLYSRLKQSFSNPKDDLNGISYLKLLLSGTIAGCVSSSITTPADVIKTRLQAKDTQFTGIIHCFKETLRKEGVSGLYKGIIPRTLRSGPQFGVTLLVYEILQRKM